MKTYISVGIGDMMCLDSILTPDERKNISEIFWATHAGKYLVPLFEENLHYPNLVSQHTISDEEGRLAMQNLDATAINFWHFRPDFPRSFEAGLRLFGVSRQEVNPINILTLFTDSSRTYQGSSFLENASMEDLDDIDISLEDKNYILFHYPTSTRPRGDIATIDNLDWDFVESLSCKFQMKVVVITDTSLVLPLSNCEVLKMPPITVIPALTKYAAYYAGCDSFVSILASKVLPPQNLFIKSSDRNIQHTVLRNKWLQRFFLPHDPLTISKFYKNYLGKGIDQ